MRSVRSRDGLLGREAIRRRDKDGEALPLIARNDNVSAATISRAMIFVLFKNEGLNYRRRLRYLILRG